MRDAYEVHPLAKRYAKATRLVPYNAIGINWLMDIAVENPALWIREKIMGSVENFSGFSPTSIQMVKQLDFAVCNLIFRTENTRIVIDCNYHFQLANSSIDMIVSTLDAWQRCQRHLTGDLLPQL